MKYINSKFEIAWGDDRMKYKVMDPTFDYHPHKKELSPFFEQYGFKVSMMYDHYYSSVNGIHSDRYISMDVYYMYILPALNRYDFLHAYDDKNIYKRLLPNVMQPVTVVKNMNGHFYAGDSIDEEITLDNAVDIICNYGGEMMIKPSIMFGDGVSVAQITDTGKAAVRDLLKSYDYNFIVQEKVYQHPDIQRVNPTSLNSMRIYTYRHPDGSYEYLYPYAHLRIGGKGAIKDNVSQGGGTCIVMPDGTVDDNICFFRRVRRGSLKRDHGITNLVIPNYSACVAKVLELHKYLPYFDFVGWDMTIMPDGTPLFIEFNLMPSVEGPQMLAGPMFADQIDEILPRAGNFTTKTGTITTHFYPRGSETTIVSFKYKGTWNDRESKRDGKDISRR